MKSIVCFGDSNTYGYNPNEGGGAVCAYGRGGRGLLGQALGEEFRVIEEGLNGRTTVFPTASSPCVSERRGIYHPLRAVSCALCAFHPDARHQRHQGALSPFRRGNRIFHGGAFAQTDLPASWLSKKPEILLVAPMPLEDALVDDEFSSASIAQSKKLPAIYERLSGSTDFIIWTLPACVRTLAATIFTCLPMAMRSLRTR